MAGGKLTPRQKMINLMYLVFIAMLALNMSKEVLSAFGSINEKLDRSNENFDDKNTTALNELKLKSTENDKFKAAAAKADQANTLSDAYYAYIASEKKLLLAEVEDPKDYEAMDQTTFLDERYWRGGKITPSGTEFLAQMDKYRNGMIAIMGNDNPVLSKQISEDFSSADVVTQDGATKVNQNYLSYHFVGFPAVSSLTKMTSIQNDIKVVENEYLSKLLSGNLRALTNISEANYETVMNTTKGAYYTGETFDGKLSLGRVDETTQPSEVNLTLDGRKLSKNQWEFDGGRVVLKVGAGSVGEHTIGGELIFDQDGEKVPVKVNKKFTTIDKPNSATIAADKMNVVYRGVDNPMTITFAGIQDKDVKATAPGLSEKSGSSYVMRPGNGSEVKINVTGKFDGGKSVSDSKTFRIKGIPRPTGTIRGEDGSVKMTRASLEASPIDAKLLDFDFDLKLKVTQFSFKVEGAGTVKVSGTRLNTQAKNALKRAKRGSTVQIFDIKAQIQGNSSYRLPKVAPIFIELSN